MLTYLALGGLTSGAIYALVALGIVLVYKATGIINFAHGEFLMISGFVAYALGVTLQVPYLLAVLGAVVIGFLLGAIVEMLALRQVIRANIVSIVLATVGISFILKGLGRLFWGGKGDYLAFPPLVPPDPIIIGDIIIVPQQLVVLGGAAVIMIIFATFFKTTRMGKTMQATADNPKAARLVGVRVETVHQLAFGVSAAIAGAAAALMAPITLLYPDMGFSLFIKGFAAAVLGGLNSIAGALLGGILIGLIESLAGGYLHSSFLEVSAFIAIMLTLLVRPSGLLGSITARRA